MRTAHSPARFTVWPCLAEVLTLLGYATFPTLLNALQAEWSMSNTQAGVVSGACFGGCMLAVPLLSALTDRIDARASTSSPAASRQSAASGSPWWPTASRPPSRAAPRRSRRQSRRPSSTCSARRLPSSATNWRCVSDGVAWAWANMSQGLFCLLSAAGALLAATRHAR